jgi:hypothetical protein
MLGRLRAIALVVCLSSPSVAVAGTVDSLPASPRHERVAPAGPTMQSAATAFGARTDATTLSRAASDSLMAAMQRRNDVSKPVAIMIVGGAAIVLGAVIDNDVGELIVIGGVVAVLYGLYQYLK